MRMVDEDEGLRWFCVLLLLKGRCSKPDVKCDVIVFRHVPCEFFPCCSHTLCLFTAESGKVSDSAVGDKHGAVGIFHW